MCQNLYTYSLPNPNDSWLKHSKIYGTVGIHGAYILTHVVSCLVLGSSMRAFPGCVPKENATKAPADERVLAA